MKLETRLAQIGNKKEKKTGAVNFPVYFSTAYEHISLGVSTGYDYSRTANPTRDVLEEAISQLEGGNGGFACSSGMAAIHTLMGLFSAGDHFVVSLDLYGGTYRLFEEVLTRFGLSFTYVDLRRSDDVKRAIGPNTKAVFIESPTNPLMHVTDLKQIAQIAKQAGCYTIVDNTFMTPYFQRPLELGADIVVHSATKYLGGHNDVLAGLIVVKGDELAERLRFIQNSIGAALGPLDTWLLMRGMKTLALRMEKHQENALAIAEYLKQHPLVDEVFYPSLNPESKAILDEQADGYGGMISFRVRNSGMIASILENLNVITFAESLGGVESLITYPARQTHADVPAEIRESIGVCDRLLRLSVGIEHKEDLIADLDQALKKADQE
ncbi:MULTISPECIES: aminotransferase class I/II-fold pyridoxal phosphate-dependent enzyme [unclassified Thermoactinomyces]|uniref:aminotransferase class I/II-fold pyridoxal phosphate-dependent enzyme n=1 Tax=unclassified Thermoactinomyces TaxID=2634588 RepID=UPI0018DBC889|nr:aminotransferase class V-fold PLP-dependent enzyme [Thermoactinomyces sp. CICC 10523]MBH8602909.1 aminotransferase class V-fold PLP-dependent enzyme [Thermoactinomyces sp. CICC 10522]MBH8607243.1 aminotransferase class V-fold PLP-dependent enzyme [Thermoactinomyces sp. CICC 10521]